MPHANDNDQDLYAVEVSDCYGGTDTIFVTGYKDAVETAKRENERDRTMGATISKVVAERKSAPLSHPKPLDKQKIEKIVASLGASLMEVTPKAERTSTIVRRNRTQTKPSELQRMMADGFLEEAIKSGNTQKAFACAILRRPPKLRRDIVEFSESPARRLRDVPRIKPRSI